MCIIFDEVKISDENKVQMYPIPINKSEPSKRNGNPMEMGCN